MESIKQIALVKKLEDLKRNIRTYQDKEAIGYLIKEIIKISTSVPPCINPRHDNERYQVQLKEGALAALSGDLRSVNEDEEIHWEPVYLDVSISTESPPPPQATK